MRESVMAATGFSFALKALQATARVSDPRRVARHGIELDNSGTRLCDFGSAA